MLNMNKSQIDLSHHKTILTHLRNQEMIIRETLDAITKALHAKDHPMNV